MKSQQPKKSILKGWWPWLIVAIIIGGFAYYWYYCSVDNANYNTDYCNNLSKYVITDNSQKPRYESINKYFSSQNEPLKRTNLYIHSVKDAMDATSYIDAYSGKNKFWIQTMTGPAITVFYGPFPGSPDDPQYKCFKTGEIPWD